MANRPRSQVVRQESAKLLYAGAIPAYASMKIPPKPKTPYVLDSAQDRRILGKLNKLGKKKIDREKEKILKLLYSQLETDWRTPLEKFIDKLL